MRDIGRYPLVMREEATELANRIAGGDDQARDKLILGNLRLVIKIAHGFRGRGVLLCDLVAEGNMGLLQAVGKFDPAKGASFGSYASWWIKSFIRQAISNHGQTLRLPVEATRKIGAIQDVKTKFAERLGRMPSVDEIARETGFGRRTIFGIHAASSISLDAHTETDGAIPLRDLVHAEETLSPDRAADRLDTLRRLAELVRLLPNVECTVLSLYYGLNDTPRHTFIAIGRIIRRTKQGTMVIHRRALGKLRRLMQESGTGQLG